MIFICAYNIRHDKGDRRVLGGIDAIAPVRIQIKDLTQIKDSTNIMPHNKSFDANEENNNQTPLTENTQKQTDITASEPQRQEIEHLLIGSREAVESTIRRYILIGQAQVGEWSPLQPCPHSPGKIMSILVRHITVE